MLLLFPGGGWRGSATPEIRPPEALLACLRCFAFTLLACFACVALFCLLWLAYGVSSHVACVLIIKAFTETKPHTRPEKASRLPGPGSHLRGPEFSRLGVRSGHGRSCSNISIQMFFVLCFLSGRCFLLVVQRCSEIFIKNSEIFIKNSENYIITKKFRKIT